MSTQQRAEGKPHKKRKIKQKPVLEQVPASQQQQQQEDGNSKFARALGSTDYGTREKGLQALSRFLVHKDSMSELDMMKLWKGVFFCFWHSDKVPVQVRSTSCLS
jgi:ribosomal RNA-processing protein 1